MKFISDGLNISILRMMPPGSKHRQAAAAPGPSPSSVLAQHAQLRLGRQGGLNVNFVFLVNIYEHK